MEKLVDLIEIAKMTSCDGVDYEYRRGYIEALNFAIRMYKEDWNIDRFKQDLKETEINLSSFKNCEYADGILGGLKTNIKIMEELQWQLQTN
ncbi:MAG: hypothetical protein J6D47_12275 [Peptostreptococcaceae bacterium]|nr:hypothetical protein [Peptostreptococcaceae bacterium]